MKSLSQQQEAQQKFLLLLQQLELTEDVYMSFFEKGELDRVTVHKKHRVWNFKIKLQNILPFQLYQLVRTRMAEKFASIAQVTLTIEAAQPVVTEPLVLEYWYHVIEQIADVSPLLRENLITQVPKWTGQKLIVTSMLEIEYLSLKSKYTDKIADSYRTFGFPLVPIEFQLVEESEALVAAKEEFFQQRQEEEDILSKQALTDYALREKDKAANPGSVLGDRPFQLGSFIKNAEPVEICTVLEEERSIVIEGFVFASDIKELRSGRSLLEMKMTDYTDSMLVKMFSRNDEDAEMMKQLKKGMWVSVRGSVQMDNFVRDLVMMAQDINEVKKEPRKDTAPEGEKRVELHLHTPMSQMDAVTPIDRLVAQAAKWGHPAIAITDHAVVQGVPRCLCSW